MSGLPFSRFWLALGVAWMVGGQVFRYVYALPPEPCDLELGAWVAPRRRDA